jgi:glycolate oxidase FAD binding subunit
MQTLIVTRPGTEADAIDGVVPRSIAEPETPEAFAETLAHASRERLQTIIRGGGSKIAWGRPPRSVDLVVSTRRLARLVAHRHGDLTVTVQAGMRLQDLNRALRAHNQWLPVESAFDDATVGGIVATNDAGPSRFRNGTPRDLVIGMTLALTDGRLVKSGGTVVKNVAGYDLGRLMAGSHGTLAGIADVTFKLVPIPAASSTLVVMYGETQVDALVRDVAALASSQIEPSAFDVTVGAGDVPYRLQLRIATSPAATDAQIAAARALVSGESSVVRSGTPLPPLVPGRPAVPGWEIDAEQAWWRSHEGAPWRGDACVRLAWLPARLPQVIALVGEIQHVDEVGATLTAHVGGSGLLRLSASAPALIASIERLRASRDVGNVVVLRGPREVREAVDVWGPPRESDRVVRALKQMFDPAGILNAGRGPV